MNQRYTILTLLGVLFLLPHWGFGQAGGCDGSRYYYSVFEEFQMTTVQYGKSTNYLGQEQDLLMDVYEPLGDTVQKRPALIFAYGGAFVAGSRADVAEICIEYARRGYVATAIDYRLYPIIFGIPDSLTVADVVVKGMHDMKAAIRYLRQDAATNNLFRVDTSRIVSGGASAGAIIALHAAFANENDEIPLYFSDIIADNGGWEGESGDAQNLLYSSEVLGVINLSGGLHKKAWLDAGEAFLISYHGTNDEIVPYEHGIAQAPISGLDLDFISLDGSGLLHARADSLNIPNLLVSVPGGMHEDVYFDPFYEPYREVYTAMGNFFMFEQWCPDWTLEPPVLTDVAELPESRQMELFPNPASERMVVAFEDASLAFTAQVFDLQGRLLLEKNGQTGSAVLDRDALGKGMFVLVCQFEDPAHAPAVGKIVFH